MNVNVGEKRKSELMGRKAKRIALIIRKGETSEPMHQNHQTATRWLKQINPKHHQTHDSITIQNP